MFYNPQSTLDIQGHRGCRGLLPENSIEGFIHAMDLGVHTLEMDVVYSKDHKVIVSHEPYFSSKICRWKNGQSISVKEEKNLKTFNYTLEEMNVLFECGAIPNEDFKLQKQFAHQKPLLASVVKAIKLHAKENKKKIPCFNIEIKRVKNGDGLFQPDFRLMVELLIGELQDQKIQTLTTVQCFDPEILNYLKEKYPEQQNAFLVENPWGLNFNLKKLNFQPDIYSPYYKRVNKRLVRKCKLKKMKLIPWTINEPEDMKDMIQLGVDGIISDYPDKLIQIVTQEKN